MRKRFTKVFLALILAFGGSFFLVSYVFYADRPAIQPGVESGISVLGQSLKKNNNVRAPGGNKVKSPRSFSPLKFSRKEPFEDSKSGQNSVFPTDDPEPTYDPEKRITPIRQDGSKKSGGSSSGGSGSSAGDLLALINAKRQAEGASSLTFNISLNAAALSHAQTTPDCGHTGADGSSPAERAKRKGYTGSGIGENIACGARSSQEAYDLWLTSPGHYAIMVNKSYRSAGIGVDGEYWVFMGGTD